MAELVLGLASSHSPQLSTPAEGWAGRGERDRGHDELIGADGITSNYEDLMARIDADRIAREITPAKFEQRHHQNQKAIAHLSQKLYDIVSADNERSLRAFEKCGADRLCPPLVTPSSTWP